MDVGFDKESKFLGVTGVNCIMVFSCENFKLINKIPTAASPIKLRFNPVENEVFAVF